MNNIAALIAMAIATTGEDVILRVYHDEDRKVAACLENDTENVMTFASDWNKLFITVGHDSALSALAALDALCKSDVEACVGMETAA